MEKKQFILHKKVAKHGKQNIIILPKILHDELKPRTIVKVTIDVLKEAENE